jgi:hypothetical protein
MDKDQIIDEVHQNYVKETMFDSDPKWLEPVPVMDMKTGEKSMGVRQYGKESFINKIKTDPEFSEKWGLKIEERELSLEERKQIVKNKYFIEFYWKIVDEHNNENTIWEMNKRNIPTKLITITYNNETIESYE